MQKKHHKDEDEDRKYHDDSKEEISTSINAFVSAEKPSKKDGDKQTMATTRASPKAVVSESTTEKDKTTAMQYHKNAKSKSNITRIKREAQESHLSGKELCNMVEHQKA